MTPVQPDCPCPGTDHNGGADLGPLFEALPFEMDRPVACEKCIETLGLIKGVQMPWPPAE